MEQSQIERLTKVIEASGFSTRAFSQEIGLTNPQRIYNALKGKNRLSKDLAERISKRFPSVTSTWLLSGSDQLSERLNLPSDKKSGSEIVFLKEIIERYKKREDQLIEENQFLREQIKRLQND